MQEMTPAADDDEISLIDLFAVLLRYKVMIIVLTVVAAVGAVVFSIISLVLPPEKSPLPNQFTPEAHMLITESSSGGSGLSSMLSSSGLGSLASLAGVSSMS
ncbi:MAG: lipopolysaccharide biosynthesis protein, partial [Treponemataceae bacterium]|nr:lipopolysaccharide biosynthesis protein [Treponemataceae bacterium]